MRPTSSCLRLLVCFIAIIWIPISLHAQAPQISNVTPATAIAGTQVTITGTGFGATQGSGNVWLGSTYGVVVSWSDTQVVATVASGSKAGVAQILQGGVWSNSVTFTVVTPNITNVAPTTAVVGTQVTITGTGFGATQGGGNVWLGSTHGVVVSWSDTQIVATVASGSKAGVAQILQGGVWSNSVTFTVVTPNITNVTPTSGVAGTQVTIAGTGFGATQGSGNVWLGSTYGVVVSWSDTQVVATVASGSKAGVAQILQGGVWSNSVTFTVTTPNITNVTPTTAIAGTQVTMTGTGFGATQGNGNVWLGSTYGVVVSWSDTQVVATVASGSKAGVAQILQGGVWSNSVTFTVVTPNITNVTPVSGVAGTQVTITGTGFGATQGSGNVWLGSTYGVVVSWSDTQVVATVASGSKAGVAQILQGGVWSNSVTFTVVTPNITNVTPVSGVAGTQVTITGTGFGATQGSGNVWLGSTYGVVVSWSDTQVVATVASGSKAGVAQILQGGVWSNSVTFTVVTPNIMDVTPTGGVAGTQVTITGTGFGATQGSGNVWLGSTYGVVVSWSDRQVVAAVASGSTSGVAQILQGGVWSNTVNFAVTIALNISTVTPTSGVAGTQVTITGSGFGATQGNGNVWLGSNHGAVVSWSDTQVVATVASGAISGIVQIQRDAGSSNSIPFVVNGPSVISITPTVGTAGTQVVVSGSGFGDVQGNGNVWLGTVPAVISSWSDGQIVATVSTGAATGNAQVLQNGVMSSPLPFTVPVPHITSITPNSAGSGTTVTIYGSGFGGSTGGGGGGGSSASASLRPSFASLAANSASAPSGDYVWIGSTYGSVISWSDKQIVASVAANAVSGVVKVYASGVWSNTIAFTVPPSLGTTTSVSLVPSVIGMIIGDTRTVQALDSNGRPVVGLSWASTDLTVATLSTDDPPVITAVGPGNATIIAGNASVDLTVYPGPQLPTGAILWSNPGNGSGVNSIVPAVPSATGVADVFAQQGDCSVQATRSDGTTAWTAGIGTSSMSDGTTSCNQSLPDFQGGLVVKSQSSQFGPNGVVNQSYIQRFDGMTGTSYPPYNLANPVQNTLPPVVVHTDGTIFTIDGDSVIGLDPTTGSPKFSIQLEHITGSTNVTDCSSGYPVTMTSTVDLPPLFGQMIIAGDGYAYVPYSYGDGTTSGDCNQQTSASNGHIRILRVGSTGDATKIILRDTSSAWTFSATPDGAVRTQSFTGLGTASPTGGGVNGFGTLITNSDQGVLLSWEEGRPPYDAYSLTAGGILVSRTTVPGVLNKRLTAISANGVTSDIVINPVGTQDTDPTIVPILQTQDGTYVGTVAANVTINGLPCLRTNMVAFDSVGNQRWVVQNYTPQIATADSGVIASYTPPIGAACPIGLAQVTTFDQAGSATGTLASLPIHSWKGAYQLGSIDAVPPVLGNLTPSIATTFAAAAGGNFTGNDNSFATHTFGLAWGGTGLGEEQCGSGTNNPQYKYYSYTTETASAAQSLVDQNWITLLKVSAHLAFDGAFPKLPIIIQNGSKGAEFYACVLDKDPAAGGNWGTSSAVYYFGAMEQAQVATGYAEGNGPDCGQSWCNFSPPQSDRVGMLKVINAIGRALGNAAAHESGHYLKSLRVGGQPLPVMDCGLANRGPNPPQVECDGEAGAVNFVYEFYNGGSGAEQDPTNENSQGGQFFFVEIPGHPIKWGTQDLCWIKKWVGQTDPNCN